MQGGRSNPTLLDLISMRDQNEAYSDQNMAVKKASGPLSPLYRNSKPLGQGKANPEGRQTSTPAYQNPAKCQVPLGYRQRAFRWLFRLKKNAAQKSNRYPRIIFASKWSVARVTPTPTPKLNSHFSDKLRSIAGIICCCCCETGSNPVTGPSEP